MRARSRSMTLASVLVLSSLTAVGTAAGQLHEKDSIRDGGPPPRFQFTRIETFGGKRSGATGLNESGQVVGWAEEDGGNPFSGSWAFLWEDGELTNLGALPGEPASWATDVNEHGVVSGTSRSDRNDQTAWVWQDGTMTSLGTLGGPWSSAMAIDDAGTVVGWALPPSDSRRSHAFTFSDDQMIGLGTVAQGVWSSARDLNSRGTVVGYAQDQDTYQQAMRWTASGGMQLLPNLAGIGQWSWAQAINEAGVIVGTAKTGELHVDDYGTLRYGRHAVLWQHGVIQDLGTLGGVNSMAFDVNGKDQVVGWAEDETGDHRAFLRHEGRLYDLNDLVTDDFNGVLTSAEAINDAGQIVGEVTINDRRSRAYLLTPIR